MSLAVRLLLALGSVALIAAALVGWFARDVARREVRRGFENRIDATVRGVHDDLAWEAETLAGLLTPLCKHDSFVDRTMVELERAQGQIDGLPAGSGIALRKLVPAQGQALRLDELTLLTDSGVVLGSSNPARLGSKLPDLARRLRGPAARPQLVREPGGASIEVHCLRRGHGVSLGLVGARKVGPLLARLAKAYDAKLRLPGRRELPATPGTLTRQIEVATIPGLRVQASISLQTLHETLAKIDSAVLLTGTIALLLSVALAMWLARGLAQPIVELANEARTVTRGDPHPVRERGTRELRQFARSFNRAIAELSTMRRRLAHTERIAARRQIARQVAHEIKNPLAPIRAAVETLRRLRQRQSPEFDGYFDEATRTVLDEVHRIKTIVGEFTKFARLPPPAFGQVDLDEIARAVVGLHAGAAGEEGATVVLRSAGPCPLVADRDQLVQVLTNLVQNGVEAANANGGQPHVEVVIDAPAAGEAHFAVLDNGTGIDPAVRARLFEPYVSTKPQGTGLGLAIVQTIVVEHGGEIDADNRSGGGARFAVTLPLKGPALLEQPPDATGVGARPEADG